ncbi:MAG: hypothetical protein ACTSRU_09040 [Candidatus Hodarchaeales archaeon]
MRISFPDLDSIFSNLMLDKARIACQYIYNNKWCERFSYKIHHKTQIDEKVWRELTKIMIDNGLFSHWYEISCIECFNSLASFTEDEDIPEFITCEYCNIVFEPKEFLDAVREEWFAFTDKLQVVEKEMINPLTNLKKEELQDMISWCDKNLKDWEWSLGDWWFGGWDEEGEAIIGVTINPTSNLESWIPLPLIHQSMKHKDWCDDHVIIPDLWMDCSSDNEDEHVEHDGWVLYNIMTVSVSLIDKDGVESSVWLSDDIEGCDRFDHDNPHYLAVKALKWFQSIPCGNDRCVLPNNHPGDHEDEEGKNY